MLLSTSNHTIEPTQSHYPPFGDPVYTDISGILASTILAGLIVGLVVGLVVARYGRKRQDSLRANFDSQWAEYSEQHARLVYSLELSKQRIEDIEAHLRRRNQQISRLTDSLEQTFAPGRGIVGRSQYAPETGTLLADALLHRHEEVVNRIKRQWGEAMREREVHKARLHKLADTMGKQQAAIDALKKTAVAQQRGSSERESDRTECPQTDDRNDTKKNSSAPARVERSAR